MWVPHTIPRKVMKTYTPGSMRDDPDALKRQYKGRILRSEDPDWKDEHEELKKDSLLKEQNLNLIIDNYEYLVRCTDEQNRIAFEQWEKEKSEWEQKVANYQTRRESYEKKKMILELAVARREYGPVEFDEDDDDDDVGGNRSNEAKLASLKEPQEVAETFKPFAPQVMVLDKLSNFERIVVIEELNDLIIPFEIAVETIPDAYYWERSATKKWPNLCKDSNTSWRQTYLEHHFKLALEDFHPWNDDFSKILDLASLLSQEISCVQLAQLIPICYGITAKPIPNPPGEPDIEMATGPGQEFDEGMGEEFIEIEARQRGMTVAALEREYLQKMREAKEKKIHIPSDDEEEEGEDVKEEDENAIPKARYDSSHFDFSLLLPRLSVLVKLSLVYNMEEVGLDWEQRLATFTDTDCLNLARGLAVSHTIEIFELNKSQMTGEQCKTLVREGLIQMAHLKSLNLAYNKIGDVGAKALARLIADRISRAPHTVHTLKLCRNNIRNRGAKALSFALSLNTYLTELDLRLNYIGDPGGKDFGHALVVNKSLKKLSIAANRISSATCYVLGKMLTVNEKLISLDVSSNNLDLKGGEYLALGMRSNKTLLQLDVRLTSIGEQFSFDVMVHLRKNRARVDYSLVDVEDYYPPEEEDPIIEEEDEEEEEEESSEEEEEEEFLTIKSATKPGSSSDSDH